MDFSASSQFTTAMNVLQNSMGELYWIANCQILYINMNFMIPLRVPLRYCFVKIMQFTSNALSHSLAINHLVTEAPQYPPNHFKHAIISTDLCSTGSIVYNFSLCTYIEHMDTRYIGSAYNETIQNSCEHLRTQTTGISMVH